MTSITLTLPAFQGQITSGLHSTNYALIQAAINGGLDTTNLAAGAGITYTQLNLSNNSVPVAKLAAGLAGQFLGGTTPAYAYPPGYQLDYAQIVSDATTTATTAASAAVVITGNAVSYDGTDVFIEFNTPQSFSGTTTITYVLYDGSTQIGNIAVHGRPSPGIPVYVKLKVTPSVASHTYSIKAFVDAGTGTTKAGNGAAGNLYPSYIRVTKA